jgi:tripartite-type tricarboxylate transporter receptor subunit TctC
MTSRMLIAVLAALVALAPVATPGQEKFPSKPITVLVPWSPGGSTDLTMRALAEPAAKTLGQPVVVINKTGGGGFVANGELAKAAPDGYTYVVNASSTIVLAPHLRKPAWDPLKFTPVLSYGVYPFMLAVKDDSPFKNFKDLVEHIRSNPGKVKFSTSGPDAMENLAMFMLQDQARLNFQLVPFEGGAPAVTAALGGHVDGFIGVGEAIPHVRGGKMRALVTFLGSRMAGFPDVPTLKEQGYDIVVESRLTVSGPPGVPESAVKTVHDALRKAMEDENFKKVAKTFEVQESYQSPADVKAFNEKLSAQVREILIKIGRLK